MINWENDEAKLLLFSIPILVSLFSFCLDIEDVVLRVIIVGVILTFRSLTQDALETVRSFEWNTVPVVSLCSY